jgi:hypothetical protein
LLLRSADRPTMNVTFHALAAVGIAVGRNTIVSWTNHLIVIVFAAAGAVANPWVFRFMPPRPVQEP